MFRLTALKNMKVYLKLGDDPNKLKDVKQRRRLNSVLEDKPLEVNKYYPINLSEGKLNLLIVPDPGTKPGETELNFEYRIEGEKIPPPAPKPPVVIKKPDLKPKAEIARAPAPEPVVEKAEEKPVEEPVPEKESGVELILIIACGALAVLVLVCCVVYVQYRTKLNE